MNGFSISNTIASNKTSFVDFDYNYNQNFNEKVNENVNENVNEKVNENVIENVNEKLEECKIEDLEKYKVIDFNFNDFNLEQKLYTPLEKSLVTYSNIKKKWIWIES
jgi:hypothetical protein